MIKYIFKQKMQIKLSMYLMPIFTKLFVSHRLNTFVWKLLGVKVGKNSIIRTGTVINAPFMVSIGDNSVIHGHLKSRGGIKIGNNVEFVENITVSTQSHDIDSLRFESIYMPVIIEDYSWISLNSIILQGVTIKKGSIVAAGAVVTKDTIEYGVYAGVPAKMIKKRLI